MPPSVQLLPHYLDRTWTAGLAVLLALLFGLVGVQRAQATIVIGQGIDGVTLGDTEAKVVKTIGPPGFREHFEESSGDFTIWKYPKGFGGVITFNQRHRVVTMWMAEKRQHTNTGISMNSSPAQVRRAYPRAQCKLGAGPGAGPGEESMACVVKSRYHGRTTETAFEWRNKDKAMEEIDIGFVH
jgi:hypothetical protein